jgi:CBS domain containing-hemolysin-like protein
MRLFAPVIRLFGGLADRAVRLLGIEPAEELSTVRSRQELVTLVRRSRTEGTLDAAEAVLLTRAFRFGDKSAADALTPRTDIVSLRTTDAGADLLERSTATGLSRFPVVGADLDDIVGVVHVKALIDVPFDERATVAVAELMSEPFVVPESRDLGHLLLEMREQRAQLTVVLDEYGGTAGIVTLEDLLEEIVGDIEDEHDPGRRTARPLGRTLLVPGGLHRDEVVDTLGFELPDGEFETLAGYLLDRLGHIPTVGEQVVDDGWTFTVVTMDRRRIDTVQVSPPPSPAPSVEAI